MDIVLKVIAHIKTDFPEKFGIPRQSGVVPSLRGKIIFEKEFRDEAFTRGLDGYSHIWLLWNFSKSETDKVSPTVRPPRLGGNRRVGVFATRSPYRPNPIALSCVKLESIEYTEKYGTVINVSGVDLLDGTPIFDIKPYLPYTDMKPDALSGLSTSPDEYKIPVSVSDGACDCDLKTLGEIKDILSNDPRPSYQDDNTRIYGLDYAGYSVKFKSDGDSLLILSIKKSES